MSDAILRPCEDTGDALSALPQKPGAPDCLHYARTGRCDYGIRCRFNHPPKRMLDEAFDRRDGYPERVGQPECQFYLKTGTCKFGSTCRYHHPREKAGTLGKTFIANGAGYPLRPNEKDCAYYVQTGTCKFGMFCKFNHPHPTSLRTITTGTGLPSAFPSLPLARAPYMQGQLLHSSCYAPILVPPEGLIPMPGWTAYQVQMRPLVPMSSFNVKQHTFGATPVHEGAASRSIHASYSTPYMVGSAMTGLAHSNNLSKDSNFPQRPGQPECKYYIKTGDCKFGASCHFDHPKRWILSLPGLPERPGTQLCAYYMQYGTCSYGIACQFDHPTTRFTESPFRKPFGNRHLFPYSQMFATPTFPHSTAIDTFSGASMQQGSKDNGTAAALVDGEPLANQSAVGSGESRDSSADGSESKAEAA